MPLPRTILGVGQPYSESRLKIPPICAFSHGMDSLDMFEDLGWLMLVIVSAFTLALAWFPR